MSLLGAVLLIVIGAILMFYGAGILWLLGLILVVIGVIGLIAGAATSGRF